MHFKYFYLAQVPWKLPVPNLEKSTFHNKSYKAPKGTEPGIHYSKHHPYCVTRFAQLLSNYHCHLSNIHKFKYLAFPDLDEVFVPRKHNTLPGLFDHLGHMGILRKHASVVFGQAYFCRDKNNSLLPGNRTSLQNTLFSNVRKPLQRAAPKSIIIPDKTDVMTIHTVHSGLKGCKTAYYMDPTLGTINHYRVPNTCKQSEIINDFGLMLYYHQLERKVEAIKHRIGTFQLYKKPKKVYNGRDI